jgi:glycosyl hydrolase family 26
MSASTPSPASFVHRTLAALVVLVSAVAAVNVSGSSADPQPALPLPGLPALPGLPDLSSSPAPDPTGPPGALFGAYVQAPGDDHAVQMAAVERRERDLGRRLAIDHHFYPWEKAFPTERERADLRDGRIPMISWNGKTLNLAIGLGQHDELIRSRARAVKALGGKVLIRWMWEMDGRQKAEHTTHPALYIAAWRHIHDVFADEGATNVQWVWCPNATAFRTEDERNAPAYYPGDDYVDWICADGYNWAPGRKNDQWRSFAGIYQDFYDWGLSRGKPLMVGEYGAQERDPGEKARWLTDARETLKTEFTGIKAVVYFDANKDYDWRVTSSPETLAAFRAMANDPWFTPDPNPLLDAASSRPTLAGIPIPLSPLQFVPRTPPKAPDAPPEPPEAPGPPGAPEPPSDPALPENP